VKEMDNDSPDVLFFHEKYKIFREKAEKSISYEIKSKVKLKIKRTMVLIQMTSLISLKKIE